MSYLLDFSSQIAAQVKTIAIAAGKKILPFYNSSKAIEVQQKADQSPLTAADQTSHQHIVTQLAQLTPSIPILSEESAPIPADERLKWQQYWLIDPLDGTKEFINHNDEFTVNIAFIDNHKAVFGVVYVPVLDVCYLGGRQMEPQKITADGNVHPLQCRRYDSKLLTIVASRRHQGDKLQLLLDHCEKNYSPYQLTSMGSSLKICLLAEGKADLYPRLAPTCEWDTAAAQAILEAAGGTILINQGESLNYNTKESLVNPWFLAIADKTTDWSSCYQFLNQ